MASVFCWWMALFFGCGSVGCCSYSSAFSWFQYWTWDNSFPCFCYRGSYFKSRGGWSRNLWVCCCDLGCHWWCLITDLAGVGQGVAEDVVWDVSGGVWSRNGLGGVAEVFGCRWWWLDGVLWKVRVLLVIFDCVGGCWRRLIVGVAGRHCGDLRRVLSRASLVVLDRIQYVVEGVAYRVLPVSPIGL